MVKYTLRRLIRALFSLFLVVSIMFCLLRLMPIEGYLGADYEKLNPEVIANKLAALGLDKPIWEQLLIFWKNFFRGDLGKSWIMLENVPVMEIIAPKALMSAKMGLLSITIALCLGLPLGIVMARCKGQWPDKLGTGFIMLVQAVPSAVYYLFIQMYGTKGLGIPMLFMESDWRTWILPTLSLALPSIVSYAMWIRRYMVDQSNQDYVKLARAKGVDSKTIMSRHVMRNAFVPMAQTLPGSILYTMVGSLYVESIYSVPGMGGLLVKVIQRQDNTLVQALILIYAAIGITGLFLGDVLMSLIDPRISLQKGGEKR